MKSYKPTSAGIRQRVSVEYKKLLSGDARKKSLTKRILDKAGRNNRGVITTRHQGGGVKKIFRVVDFMMNKIGVPGRVATIEYDPYRSAFIALVIYNDGDQRYILAARLEGKATSAFPVLRRGKACHPPKNWRKTP